ncbi:MAG: ammonium transporter [Phycisphaerae bacterium]|jgi:ammonium transporter Rh
MTPRPISAVFFIVLTCLSVLAPLAAASEAATGPDALVSATSTASTVEQVQKYERAIAVMAMLLVGFGFLMVFVKRYGRSALTATYLLVALSLPAYFLLNSMGVFGQPEAFDIDRLLMSEFAAASLLICAGAVLGRLKMWQYLVLAALFVPCYSANEWVIFKGGLGLLPAGQFLDTGGSIVIHAFGALFGLGVMLRMTTRQEFDAPIHSDATSDRFSLLGSMVLWVFWPSFCSALVPAADVPHTGINVILALCGSTLSTYVVTLLLRRKISPADIANATLAGGVAIGTTCARPDFYVGAMVIGAAAGALSTFGFAVIQGRLQGLLKKTDTCGVLYLHGLPGLMGGAAAIPFIKTGNVQLLGILLAAAMALVTGYISGLVLSALGRRTMPYTDVEEILLDVQPEFEGLADLDNRLRPDSPLPVRMDSSRNM